MKKLIFVIIMQKKSQRHVSSLRQTLDFSVYLETFGLNEHTSENKIIHITAVMDALIVHVTH